MGWFFKRKEDRLQADLAAYGGTIFLGDTGDLDAGVIVDRETAMEISVVHACINALATDVGQVPIRVYQYTDTGRTPAVWTREYKALRFGPNSYQTAQDWKEQQMIHLLTAGDYYAKIGRVDGYWDSLYPIDDPMTVETRIRNGRKFHKIAGQSRSWSDRDIYHVHGPSPDGYSGRNFVETHRQTLSLAKALFRYGARYFRSGGRPSVMLMLPASTQPEDVEAAKQHFINSYGGDNVHGVAAWRDGVSVKELSFDPEKSQALGTRQQVIKEVCSLYRFPVWRLYGEDPPDLQARTSYYVDVLGPWLTRIVDGVNKYLIPPESAYYAEAQTEALLKADILTRYQAYQVGIQSRFLKPNEARVRENLEKADDGDQLINPNVMTASDWEYMRRQQNDGNGGSDNAGD